jgi:hypothetical protein
MTTSETAVNGKVTPPGPLVRWLTGNMWGFWFFLLVVSMGMAAGIYAIWLRGNL